MIVGGRDNDTILTVTSKLLIVHYLQNCALTTSGKQLPKWGFEQQEVSCNPNVRDPSAYWNVEDNAFEKCKYIWNLIWKFNFTCDFHVIFSLYHYSCSYSYFIFHFSFIYVRALSEIEFKFTADGEKVFQIVGGFCFRLI